MDLAAPLSTSTGLSRVVMVHLSHPHAPSFAYSVLPWSDEGEGLIAFSSSPKSAAGVVNGVLRRDPGRMWGDVAAVTTNDGPVAVRLVRADPLKAGRYALQRADPDTPARYLQLVPLADCKRSYDGPCECCPDLSPASSEWPNPFDATAWGDDAVRDLPVASEPGAPERVLLPVRSLGKEEARFERVTAERLDHGHVRLLQAPAIGDWTSAGAIHELTADGVVGERLEPGLPQFGVALERSSIVPGNTEAQGAAMERLGQLPGIAVTSTGKWLTVAAGGRHAEPARSILRRLVRDGHAHEVGSYAQPHDDDGCCVRCRPGPWLS